MYRVLYVLTVCVPLVACSVGYVVDSSDVENDGSDTQDLRSDGYRKTEDLVRLQEIMETFIREYMEYQNDVYQILNGGNSSDPWEFHDVEEMASGDSDTSTTQEYHRRHRHRKHSHHRLKRTAARAIFCSLPSPRPIREVFPVIKVFRRGQRPITIQNYAPESRVVDSIGSSLQGADRVVIVTHGFTATIESKWLYDIMGNMLRHDRRDQAIILIGWDKGAAPGFIPSAIYRQAAANTETIGRFIGGLSTHIRNRYHVDIYGVGHSLGSHVMGWAGRSGHLTRITALDPAGPCFETDNQDKRLRSRDAAQVDVIHTDGYQRFFPPQIHFGTLIPLGLMDFYPNWGRRMQPGCGKTSVACSHSRAIDLYIWSIAHPGRFATNAVVRGDIRWDHIDTNGVDHSHWTADMGYYADTFPSTNLPGNLYLSTNSQPPWNTLDKRYFNIRHAQSGKALDACTHNCAPGTVYLWSFHGGENQEWFMDGQLIRSRKFPDRVLDFHFGDYRSKGYGRVYLNDDVHARDNQRWYFRDETIENFYDGVSRRFRLDLYDNQRHNRAPVGCYPPNDGQAQRWLRTTGRAYFYVEHVPSGKVLDAHSRNARDVAIHPKRHGWTNQYWFYDNGFLRSRMFPDRVLDFHVSEFLSSSPSTSGGHDELEEHDEVAGREPINNPPHGGPWRRRRRSATEGAIIDRRVASVFLQRTGQRTARHREKRSAHGWGQVYLNPHVHGQSNQKWSFVGHSAVQCSWENRGLRLDVGGPFVNGQKVGCYRPNNTPAQHFRASAYIYNRF